MKPILPLVGLLTLLFAGCTTSTSNTPSPVLSLTDIPTLVSTLVPRTPTPTSTSTLTPTPTGTPTEVIIPTATSIPRITLIATGDVMLGRSVNQQIQRSDATWPFVNVASFLSQTDITLINLENPVVDPCPLSGGGLVFCAPPANLVGLNYAGVDVVNLANNHILDYGEAGKTSTIEYLKQYGLEPSDDAILAILNRSGVDFGFLGFNRIQQTSSMSILSSEEIASRIIAADPQVDVLIVSFHWGEEYQSIHHVSQRDLAHLAIDAGADVVIGHHPHVIQPHEEYQGKPIFYSLGNFVFDQGFSEEVKRGQIVEFIFDGSTLSSYRLLPVNLRWPGQPYFPESP